jgi:hypothetical protein
VGTGDGHDDYFRADSAWFLVVLLTIGYLVSRDLAKAGSRWVTAAIADRDAVEELLAGDRDDDNDND